MYPYNTNEQVYYNMRHPSSPVLLAPVSIIILYIPNTGPAKTWWYSRIWGTLLWLEKRMVWSWGDDSVGKIACCTRLTTWVWIPNIHLKTRCSSVQICNPRVLARRQNTERGKPLEIQRPARVVYPAVNTRDCPKQGGRWGLYTTACPPTFKWMPRHIYTQTHACVNSF